MPLFYNLFKPVGSSHQQREAHTRARSPIQLMSLLHKKEMVVFKSEVKSGPQIDSDEVIKLFDVACQTSNADAIFALAERYPEVVNAVSLSTRLNAHKDHMNLLVNRLIIEKSSAPEALSDLYDATPKAGVTKLFDRSEQQHINRLIAQVNAPTDVVLFNGEYDDSATAQFVVLPKADTSIANQATLNIKAMDDTAKTMLPDFDRWFKTKRQLKFNFPNHYPTNDGTESNTM